MNRYKPTSHVYSTTIELGNEAELSMEVDIYAFYHEGEADTWDTPGCPSTVELDKVVVTSIGTGENEVKRENLGDAIKVLDAAATEAVENEWNDHYHDNVMDDMDFEDTRWGCE